MPTIWDFVLQAFKTEKHVHPHSQKSLLVLVGLQFCLKLLPEPGAAPEDPCPVDVQNNTRRDLTRPFWTGRKVSAWRPRDSTRSYSVWPRTPRWTYSLVAKLSRESAWALCCFPAHTVLGVWQEKYHLTIFTKGQTRTHTHLFWVNASPLGWHCQDYLMPLISE